MDEEPMITPGPWRIDPDATFIGDRYVGTDSADIALMADWSIDLEPEQWANARLIAASPDLLQVANKAFDFLGGVDDAAEIRAELMAAIAKATKP
jgi:hypothetical protein